MITSEQTPVGLKFDCLLRDHIEYGNPDTVLRIIVRRTNPSIYNQTERAFNRGWLHMIDSVISLPTWVWELYTERKTYLHDDEVGY